MPVTARVEPDLEVRNQLVLDHVGLVKALAIRLAQRVPAQVEVAELISVGMVGLIDAARRYQHARGVPFDAFARRRVHGAMLDSLRAVDWAPRSARRMRRRVDGALAQLRQTLHREPGEAEIAAALNVTDDEYGRMLDQIRGMEAAAVRCERLNEDGHVLDVSVDPDDGPYVRLERAELRRHLARAIAELPVRDRRILAMYYEHELTLAEIGATLGVSESRVSQLRTQAIARLRTTLRGTLQLSEPR